MAAGEWYYQSGEGLNLLARAAAVRAPTVAGAFDTQFPVGNLYDGRPSKYARWTTTGTNLGLTFDLNLLPGGDGEIQADLDTWVLDSSYAGATITRNNSSPYSGTQSIRLLNTVPGGVHWVTGQRDIRVRAGEKLRVYHAGKIIAANNNVTVTVWAIEAGLRLQADGTWTGSGVVCATHSTSSYTDGYIDFVVPDAALGGAFWQVLRVIITANSTSGTSIDVRCEVKIVPGWDTIVVLGHDLTPQVPLLFGYQALSGNNPLDTFSSSTSVAAWLKTVSFAQYPIPVAELQRGGVWNKAVTTRYERHVQFLVTQASGALFIAPQIGELILCQAETLPVRPRLQLTAPVEAAGQIRHESGAGDVWAYNRTPIPRGRMTLRYQTTSPLSTGIDASARACLYLHIDRTHGGAHPTLVLPYTHDPAMVIYGHAGQTMALDHQPPERTFEVELVDLPIPGLHHGLRPA